MPGIRPAAWASEPSEPLFDAVLMPNDSGTRQGRVIFAAVLTAYFAIVLFAWLALHAWPAVLHAMLIGAFLIWTGIGDRHRRRERERIRVWPACTRVERTDTAGRQTVSEWQTAWLRVALEPAPPGCPRLTLGSHGRRVVLGRFLNEEERASLADALRMALSDAARSIAPVADAPVPSRIP